jgi:uncharacterized protein
MTPQEQQLVAGLFDRLAHLESTPRDPDAERLIADGAKRAPHALYALVQTALVQDEALRRANTRIEDLQEQLQEQFGGEQPQQQQGSFLDTMREAVFGHDTPHGSVPSVRAAQGSASQSEAEYASPRGAQVYPNQPGVAPPPAYSAGPGFGGPSFGGPGFAPGGGGSFGGSFLGTAASTAAGVIGGSLLLNGIRSMFDHRSGLAGSNAQAFAPGDQISPWRSDASNSDLARQAGIDDIGKHDTVASQRDDQSLTNTSDDPSLSDTSDDQFNDDDNFDTADTGSDDDSYDV